METKAYDYPIWYKIALKEIGVQEIKGPGFNPRIIEYHAKTTLKATEDEIPWCSAFVNWCMSKANIKGTGSAAARSWLKWGRGIVAPVVGCICVFKRGNSDWQGHVGFYAGESDSQIIVLGGNQSDQVKYSFYKKDDLLGFRWPDLP